MRSKDRHIKQICLAFRPPQEMVSVPIIMLPGYIFHAYARGLASIYGHTLTGCQNKKMRSSIHMVWCTPEAGPSVGFRHEGLFIPRIHVHAWCGSEDGPRKVPVACPPEVWVACSQICKYLWRASKNSTDKHRWCALCKSGPNGDYGLQGDGTESGNEVSKALSMMFVTSLQ